MWKQLFDSIKFAHLKSLIMWVFFPLIESCLQSSENVYYIIIFHRNDDFFYFKFPNTQYF